ncbi:MAG TPA: EamA family transporter [Actinospica sp.]|nr:EamA family transporter [Actinospica sp.]
MATDTIARPAPIAESTTLPTAAAHRGGYRLGVLAVVAAAALWGLGGVLADGLFRRGVQPLDLVSVRTYLTALGLGFIVAARRRRRGRVHGPAARGAPFTVLGFGISIGVANAALFVSIKLLPVAAAMVLQSLAPVLVVGFESVRDRVRPSVIVLGGLAVALPGVALVAGSAGPNGSRLDPLGVLAGLATALGVAAFALFGHSVTRTRGAIEANALAFAVSAAGWLIYELWHGLPGALLHASVLPAVLGVSVLGTLLPFVLFAWGSGRTGAACGALTICLEPAFGAVLAWIWLGQSLGAAQILGAVLVTGAVSAIQYSAYRRTR